MQLEKYPIDNLGVAARKKISSSKDANYLTIALANLRIKFESCLKDLEDKLTHLYP